MSNKQKIVRISPLNAVVFACIFRDAEKAGKAMLDFLNAVLKHVGGTDSGNPRYEERVCCFRRDCRPEVWTA